MFRPFSREMTARQLVLLNQNGLLETRQKNWVTSKRIVMASNRSISIGYYASYYFTMIITVVSQ